MAPHCPETLLPVPEYVPPTPPPQLILVDVWVAEVDKRRCNQVVRARPDRKSAAMRTADDASVGQARLPRTPSVASFDPETLAPAFTPCAAEGRLRGVPPDEYAARQARASRRRR